MKLPGRRSSTNDSKAREVDDRFTREIPKVIRDLAKDKGIPEPNRWVPSAQGVGAHLNGARVAGKTRIYRQHPAGTDT